MALETNSNVLFFHQIAFVDTGVKLDDDRAFIQSFQYENMYRAKTWDHLFSDNSLIELLRKTKPEEDLVTVFNRLGKSLA